MPVTLSETLQEQLARHGITQYDEVDSKLVPQPIR